MSSPALAGQGAQNQRIEAHNRVHRSDEVAAQIRQKEKKREDGPDRGGENERA
jgi:hypothetical protein